MKQIENYDEIQAFDGEFVRPSAGGYVLQIVAVKDVSVDPSTGKGDYLLISYDIASGDFKGYYADQNERFGGKWMPSVVKSYKEKALGMFKHFINCVEQSNQGFKWSWHEQDLVGRFFGATLQEEEYEKNDGSIGVRLAVKDIKTVKQITDGDFKVPSLKKLSKPAKADSGIIPMPSTFDDMPF